MLGSVAALYRYPVKSLRGEALERAEVRLDGFAGDRERALLVRTAGHARAGQTYRGKEHRLLHTVDDVASAQELARMAGVSVESAGDRPHFFDLEPVSIVFDAWVRELEALAGRAVDPLAFRPNIVATAAPEFAAAESALVGLRLTVGAVAFDVVAPITRCVTPSYDVATGDPDRALARALVTQRGNLMGIYCRVAVPGTIRRGDAIAR